MDTRPKQPAPQNQEKTQQKLDFRNPKKNPNMKQPTIEQLTERLSHANAEPARKQITQQLLKKHAAGQTVFTGPEYLSPDDEENLYGSPQINSQDIKREEIKFVVQYADAWITDQTNNQQEPMVAMNANPLIVGGHLWTKGAFAQEEAVVEASDLPFHMPAGGKHHTYSPNENELGLEKLGGSYRVTQVKQYAIDNSHPEGISETGTFDAVFVAAPDFRDLNTIDKFNGNRADYLREIAAKVRMQCEHALENKNSILGAGAMGCGAFQNNPFLVAAIYRAVLSEEKYKNLKVDFVIAGERLSNKFKDVFNAPASEVQKILDFGKPYDKFASREDTTFKQYLKTFPKLKKTPTNKTESLTQDDRRYKMMEFHNNYLKGLSEGFPEKYMTDVQKGWYKEIVEKYQPTVKVYMKADAVGKINPAFDRMGNYDISEFFQGYDQPPKDTLTSDDIERLKKAGCFAPEYNEGNTELSRQYTKFRVIASSVPRLGEDGKLHERKMITTCAPNFMGTSPGDMKSYLIPTDQGGYRLNEKIFREDCIELAAMIVFAAKENNMPHLDIADFGLGVYLKLLEASKGDTVEKDKARQIMYEAFILAAESQKFNINWIIYDKIQGAEQMVDDYNHKYSNQYLQFKKGNILDSEYSLNNGSDRTIGGKCNHLDASTTEEQAFQELGLLECQTTCNPHKVKNIVPVSILPNGNVEIIKQPAQARSQRFITEVQPSKIVLGKGDKYHNRFVQCHFNNVNDATNFANELLKKHGIHKFKSPGTPVNIQATAPFTIRLNNADYNKVMKDENAYNRLLISAFIKENKLDLSKLENRIFWSSQVTGVGHEIEIKAEACRCRIPRSVKFIYETFGDSKLTADQKVKNVCGNFESMKFEIKSILSSSTRSSYTEQLINNVQILKQQFETTHTPAPPPPR